MADPSCVLFEQPVQGGWGARRDRQESTARDATARDELLPSPDDRGNDAVQAAWTDIDHSRPLRPVPRFCGRLPSCEHGQIRAARDASRRLIRLGEGVEG